MRRPQSNRQVYEIGRHSVHIRPHKHFQIRLQVPLYIFKYLRRDIRPPLRLIYSLQNNIFFIFKFTEQRTFIYACLFCNLLRGRRDISLIPYQRHGSVNNFLTRLIHVRTSMQVNAFILSEYLQHVKSSVSEIPQNKRCCRPNALPCQNQTSCK